jgi:hypothetical protein
MYVPRLEAIVGVLGLAIGAGIRKAPLVLCKMMPKVIGNAGFKWIKFVGDFGLIPGNSIIDRINEISTEGVDLDLNALIDDIASDQGISFDIPDFDSLKVHIPGFEFLAEYLNPNFTAEDIWFSMGFGPSSMIPLNEWLADAAGYICRPDVLGSAMFGDIIKILSPVLGLAFGAVEIFQSFQQFYGKWNDLAKEYNSFRTQVLLVLEQARGPIVKALSILGTTKDLSSKLSEVKEFLSLDQLITWIEDAGLTDISDFIEISEMDEDSLIDELVSKFESILDPFLIELETDLNTLLESVDNFVEYIRSNWEELPILFPELTEWNLDSLEWTNFPQEGENILGWLGRFIASGFGVFGSWGFQLVNDRLSDIGSDDLQDIFDNIGEDVESTKLGLKLMEVNISRKNVELIYGEDTPTVPTSGGDDSDSGETGGTGYYRPDPENNPGVQE